MVQSVTKTDQLGRLINLAAEAIGLTREGKRTPKEVSRGLLSLQEFKEPKALVGGVQKHLIDCDAGPFVPKGWKVEEHKKGGQFVFDHPAQVTLYLSKNQQGGKCIEGHKLRKELADEPVLNANVLDYLLKNTRLIPEDWKEDEKGNTRYIFFWGTIYRYSDGDLCVRFLFWGGDAWDWSNRWLDDGWDGFGPAAVRAR